MPKAMTVETARSIRDEVRARRRVLESKRLLLREARGRLDELADDEWAVFLAFLDVESHRPPIELFVLARDFADEPNAASWWSIAAAFLWEVASI